MKTRPPPRSSSKLNYGDFAVTGLQDCQNAFDVEMFDFDAGDTAEQIFDAAFDDSVRQAWLEGSDVDEIVEDGLDPEKCYQEWRKAYRRCALPLVREAIDWAKRRKMEGTAAYWLELVDKDLVSESFVESYPSAEEAFVALAAANQGGVYSGNLDGPDSFIARTYWNRDELQFADDLGHDWPMKRRLKMIGLFKKEREAVRRRTTLNPQRRARNPADVKTEEKAIAEYYRLLTIPNDPHAMEVARDLVEAHGLSLRTLSENERTFDYPPEEREDHGKDFAGWFDIGNGEVVEWSVMRYQRGRRRGPHTRLRSTHRVAPLFEIYYEVWKSNAIACDVCGGIQQGHTCCPPDAGPERGAFDRMFDLNAISDQESRSANYFTDRRSLIAQVYGETFAIDFAVETGWQIALLIKALQATPRPGLSPASHDLYRIRAIVELVRTRNLTIPKSHLRKEHR